MGDQAETGKRNFADGSFDKSAATPVEYKLRVEAKADYANGVIGGAYTIGESSPVYAGTLSSIGEGDIQLVKQGGVNGVKFETMTSVEPKFAQNVASYTCLLYTSSCV